MEIFHNGFSKHVEILKLNNNSKIYRENIFEKQALVITCYIKTQK